MNEDGICKAEKDWQVGGHMNLKLRCDKYEAHPTDTHRTTIEDVTVYWKAS